MTKRLTMVCRYCGSPYIVKDAWASWSVTKQLWVLENVYDAAYCNSCDGELKHVEAIDLDALPALETAQDKPEAARDVADLYVIFMDQDAQGE